LRFWTCARDWLKNAVTQNAQPPPQAATALRYAVGSGSGLSSQPSSPAAGVDLLSQVVQCIHGLRYVATAA